MKAPRSLLFLGLLLAICAWARSDVIPYGTFETCKGGEGAACTMEGGFKGKCAWLTGEDRRAIGVRVRKAHCESEGVHAGRCLTCVSEAYRAAGPSKSRSDAGAK